ARKPVMTEKTRSAAPLVDQPVSTRPRSSLGRKLFIAVGVLLAIVAIFSLVVALQPAEFRVVRSATMSAPPSAVFAQINDFHNWEAWSPWAKLDPTAKNSFEGPESGEGAKFSWDGNDEVGAGQMTIVESRPSELIKMKLDFSRPMQDTSTTEFTFAPEGDQTKVTWNMYGQKDFMSKAVCMFMNMDKM